MSTDDQTPNEETTEAPELSSAPTAAPKTSIVKLLGIAVLAVAVAGAVVGVMFWKEMSDISSRETTAIEQGDAENDPRMQMPGSDGGGDDDSEDPDSESDEGAAGEGDEDSPDDSETPEESSEESEPEDADDES